MGISLIRLLRRSALVIGLAAACLAQAKDGRPLLGTYPFADHGSMHYRTEPLLIFLRQQGIDLELDVSDTFDELLRRGVRKEYTVLQLPAHFGLYLQRCCGYRIVAGWQGSVSALWLAREDALTDTQRPAILATASSLSLSPLAITEACSSQFTVDNRLHMLTVSGTHERALQALLRGKVDGAIVSGTAVRALKPDLRKRLVVVKEVSGLSGDVFLVRDEKPTPAWQVALEQKFPDSSHATELQKRWHRPQGVVSAQELQLKNMQRYSSLIEPCLDLPGR